MRVALDFSGFLLRFLSVTRNKPDRVTLIGRSDEPIVCDAAKRNTHTPPPAPSPGLPSFHRAHCARDTHARKAYPPSFLVFFSLTDFYLVSLKRVRLQRVVLSLVCLSRNMTS